ncbi:MAG: uroporphyrinogen decarboxylase family protein [Anaerolineae bacterium]
MTLTSRERVRIALQCGIPDKVPLGDFAIDYDTAERILGHTTYHRAKARCQIAYWEGRRDEVVQSLIADTIDLYRKLDVYDIVNLAAMTLGIVPPKGYHPEAPRRIDESTWEYADGRVLKYSPITADLTLVYDPAQWTRPIVLDDFPLEPVYREPDPSCFELVNAVTAAFRGERYILGPFPTAPQWPPLGDMQRSLVEMVENPDLAERALRSTLAQADLQQGHWVNPGIDGVLDGTDWAYKTGTFMSPRLWRRYCLPALSANVRAAHRAGLQFVQHACGNNWGILEGLIEAGIDGYQSIQGSAEMELSKVKQATCGRLALWGGVPVELLVDGTPDEVRAAVQVAMVQGNFGGGFILGASHSIAVGTQYANFMTMLDEFDKLRDY